VLGKATAETGYCNCGCGCGDEEMKQCFGAENVNDNGDADFQSCSATSVFSGEDGSHVESLPGCDGQDCAKADAHAHEKKTAHAEDDYNYGTAAPTPSESSVIPTSSGASSVPTLATTLGPLFTDATTLPSSLRPTTPLDPLTVPSSSGTPVTSNTSATKNCEAAVTITITPTVTVTAGSEAETTKCVPTIYETVTNTATVTVSQDNSNYGKREFQAHAHGHGIHKF